MSAPAAVNLWGKLAGAVIFDEGANAAVFQYDPAFVRAGIEISPLKMPLREAPYSFPGLSEPSFHGLPGLLAESLPDRFGNALIDAWLAAQGRPVESFDSVERLCYIGSRGMGALQFEPAAPIAGSPGDLAIDELVGLASRVLSDREGLLGSFGSAAERERALADILAVGTSAGGARAKAVIAWNPETGQVRSGQLDHGAGFEQWILKFDGVTGNRDKELEDPAGYGAIEYAYSLMAREAGINMEDCRLLEENGRRHFLTRRFDRSADGSRLHMQSLASIAHFDFNLAGGHSYEQAMGVIRELGLGTEVVEQQFRRMVFNLVARNQDDHVKNIAFLMEPDGSWSLSPAFDVTWSFQPSGAWTATHQMTVNGRRDGFTRADLAECARAAGLKSTAPARVLAEVTDAVRGWPVLAERAAVEADRIERIAGSHRLDWR